MDPPDWGANGAGRYGSPSKQGIMGRFPQGKPLPFAFTLGGDDLALLQGLA